MERQLKQTELKSTELSIPGVLVIEPVVFEDNRGFFLETFHKKKYAELGIDSLFVQDNHSRSRKSTLRGLHYQLERPQAKLIYAVTGKIFDVAVDIRLGSPTFGEWAGIIISGADRRQIYIPEGLAHGFCVLSEAADVIYKCTDIYYPPDEYGISWSDPAIGVDWPVKNPLLSEKDSENPRLDEIPQSRLPVYKG